MTIPIFINRRTPDADPSETVDWVQSVYNTKPGFYWIDHEPYRETSRWTSVPRKKQFRVTYYSNARGGHGFYSHTATFHLTLDKAKAHAAKLIAEEEERVRLAEFERTRPRYSHAYTLTVRVVSLAEDASDVAPATIRSAIANLPSEELAKLVAFDTHRVEAK